MPGEKNFTKRRYTARLRRRFLKIKQLSLLVPKFPWNRLYRWQNCQKVYVLSKFPNTPEQGGGFPKGEAILIEKVKSMPNVEIIYEAATTAIVGEGRVSGIKYKTNNGREQELVVEGIMVHIGQIPNSQFAEKVKKNKTGEIMIDEKCRTSSRGIFAAGDVTDVAYKQIGIAGKA